MSTLLTAIICLISSCNGTPEETSDTTEAAESTTEAPVDVLDPFPVADYNGATFTIMSRPVNKADVNQIAPEALNGEIINDTIYNRNKKIEDMYNVDIVWLECAESEFKNRFSASVLSNDDSFQYAAVHVIQSGTLASQGLLADLNSFTQIDMTNPWWNQNARESLTVNSRIYIGQNDIPTYTVISNNHIMYFNKTLWEKHGFDDLYALIRSGRWTLDKLDEYVKSISTDLNGDSKMDEEDLWGLITTTGSTSIFLPSCEQSIMKSDADGIPQLTLNTPKTVEIVEKIYSLCFTGNSTLIAGIDREVDFCNLFTEGHSLFYNGYVADMNMMRDMNDEFGLIPPPKFDEKQDEYYTLIQGNSDLVCIPASLPEDKREFVGIVSEALAAVSYYDVRSAIYEGAIKNKYMRDVDSEEMLDMITKNIVVDFGFVNNAGFAFPIWDLMEKHSEDFASYYAGMEESVKVYNKNLIAKLSETVE